MITAAAALPAVLLLASPAAQAPWLTRAERTGFVETSRYEETLQDCRRLEKDSPWIRVTRFGVSPEGRDLILVIASKDRAFEPAAAARTGKPIVLIQAGIHSGEIDGKDAGLMLLRDIAVTRQRAGLLDKAIVLFMPIYNVDGHERFGPYNRINQNGPKEMGWRTTSRNLNLNRDYVKADAVETRAWLRLFNAWRPDLTIDCHVTDGTDYRYDVTYAYEGLNAPPTVAAWIDEAVTKRVVPGLVEDGHHPSPYIFLKEDTDPAAGLAGFPPTPRFSTTYVALRNRPAFLIETHMLKDYRSRVTATYNTLKRLLEEVNRDPGSLRSAVRRAESEAAAPGRLAVAFRIRDTSRRVPFKGVEFRRELSEISGAMRVIYGERPLDLTLEVPDGIEPAVTVDKPLAYIVPPQWTDAIDRLQAHGLTLQRLREPVRVPVDTYRLTEPKWAPTPFEGHHPVTFATERLRGVERDFPAGSIVVRMNQADSAVAAHLLEPQAPDSLAGWGFFDSIFERKEYAEAYVMEKVAREMLAKDPALRAEFETALKDPDFAGSPTRRLDFFYRRTPWWDDRLGAYPVGLLTAPRDLPVESVKPPGD
ncbi:MAG TPA: M14 family metallopeptidase [Candidatus Polarisedimenticolia bacterium]|nr:M14 family metallopeptidase [Candidatus Polarisedimenticolia bacterium]